MKLISLSAGDLYVKGNQQDLERYPEVDLAIAADAEATLPSLIEAVKRLLTDDRKRVFHERGSALAAERQRLLDQARQAAAVGWDAKPISTARLLCRTVGPNRWGGLVARLRRQLREQLAAATVELSTNTIDSSGRVAATESGMARQRPPVPHWPTVNTAVSALPSRTTAI